MPTLRALDPRTPARFDRYLDALVAGRPAVSADLPPELVATAERLQGRVQPKSPPAAVPRTSVAAPRFDRVPSPRHRPAVPLTRLTSVVPTAVLLVVVGLGIAFSLNQRQRLNDTAEPPWLYEIQDQGEAFLRLDPETLVAEGSATPFAGGVVTGDGNTHWLWVTSGDGSTLAMAEYTESPASGFWPQMVVRVFDAETGAQRSIIGPITSNLPTLTGDGRLLIVAHSGSFAMDATVTDVSSRQPPYWYVFDTASGAAVSGIQSREPAPDLSYGEAVLSPDGSTLYHLVVDPDAVFPGPWPVQLVAHDLRSGDETDRIDLPGVEAGTWFTRSETITGPCAFDEDGNILTTSYESTQMETISPGLAVSPDGNRLAIVAGDGTAVTLVDLRRGAVDSVVPLSRSTGTTTTVDAPCQRETVRERRAAFAPDGRTLYVVGGDQVPVGEQESAFADAGLLRLDLDTGAVLTAPIGTTANRAVYRTIAYAGDRDLYLESAEYTTASGPLSDSTIMLQRIDGDSLNVLAAREIESAVGLIVSPRALAQPRAVGTPTGRTEEPPVAITMDPPGGEIAATSIPTPSVVAGAVTVRVQSIGGAVDVTMTVDGEVAFAGRLAAGETTGYFSAAEIVVETSEFGWTTIVETSGQQRFMRQPREVLP